MLFGYPIEATAENWFHDCLVEILQTIHANPQQMIVWPAIIPQLCRETLQSRTGLRDRINAYQQVVENLDQAELTQISRALAEQNEVDGLLSGRCNCQSREMLPQVVREPLRALFEYSFKLLTDLGIRDRQYHTIFQSTPYHVCPFCGCEFFDAPGAPREALDHYLAESRYTYAATNLNNLVPMGNKCNSKYKLAADILYKDDGSRRRSYFPYNIPAGVQLSLKRSEPFAGTIDVFPLPRWEIEFDPASEETLTWESVFHIRERYTRDILDADFLNWLREFSAWCKSNNRRISSQQAVIEALETYVSYMREVGFRDRAFLKAAVFEMLHDQCQQGSQRLITLISGVVVGGMA